MCIRDRSYPGTPLRQGSRGAAVFTLQRQLNRIAKDYPCLLYTSLMPITLTFHIFGLVFTIKVKSENRHPGR